MKKHLIVFVAYQHLDIISKSFESIKDVDADIFIVENQSENSRAIEITALKEWSPSRNKISILLV